MTDSPETAPADMSDVEDSTVPEPAHALPDTTTDAAAPTADAGPDDDGDAGPDGDSDGDTDDGQDTSSATGSRRRPSVQRLEEEGDVAADYLEELLDILDLDGDIDIDVENGRAAVSVVAEAGSERALKRLVGTDGEVLEALQELTRLAVQASTGERTRLMLDVAGHRAARRQQLEEVASAAVDKVRSGDQRVALEPMSPFERKVVHDTVAAAGLRSESEGEDARRHVVVLPA